MSKAILVIDMPNECMECPLRFKDGDTDDWFRFRCHISKDQIPKKDKLCNCPLKHVPTKKWYYRDNYSNDEETDKRCEVLKKVYTMIGYFNGWDDCVDEILGEK